jgi:hypothetical protein
VKSSKDQTGKVNDVLCILTDVQYIQRLIIRITCTDVEHIVFLSSITRMGMVPVTVYLSDYERLIYGACFIEMLKMS